MDSNNTDEHSINPITLNMLKNRIYTMERDNYKTKKFIHSQMVDKIRQLIERIVENDN